MRVKVGQLAQLKTVNRDLFEIVSQHSLLKLKLAEHTDHHSANQLLCLMKPQNMAGTAATSTAFVLFACAQEPSALG